MNKYSAKNNFSFVEFTMSKHKYTDNRAGCPMNFLGYTKRGHCKIVSEKKTLVIDEGELFYIPKNLVYESFWYPRDGELKYLSLGFHGLEAREQGSYELQKIQCDDALRGRLLSIPLGNPVSCEALSGFYGILADIFPTMEREAPGKDRAIIEMAKHYISENPNCSVPEIAKACFISEPYLYLLFKKVLGTTPNDYRQSYLCELGIDLLSTTSKSVEEISELLGFSSCSYFRKILKKHTGATPRDIRKTGSL
ncbi:MAG: helix-turn-helix transcriptional regulator [Clostridia bacterium]|nr:helix-turn-helix transcriptional regulator [Clostridia bacterium]